MDIEITDQKFRQYFKPHELVSLLHYTEFDDKDEIYSLFDDKLKAVMVYLRETINKPFIVNNWKNQGQFQYRGYRDRTCSIGAPKSMHRVGKAIDFDIIGWDAELSRKRIIELCIKGLPCQIRMEKGVNWVHIDVKPVENSTHKINFFAP